MAHLGVGDQVHHAVRHAKARPEDGDHGQLLVGQHLEGRLGDGGLHLHLLQRQVPGDLVAHQHGELAHQLTEGLGAGLLVAEKGQLVLYERMVDHGYFAHR